MHDDASGERSDAELALVEALIERTGRACGSCHACCEPCGLGVTDDRGLRVKETWGRCVHLGPEGCKIHPERPRGCRAFACLWLTGLGQPRDRPDAIGVMPTSMDSEGGALLLRQVDKKVHWRRVEKVVREALLSAQAQGRREVALWFVPLRGSDRALSRQVAGLEGLSEQALGREVAAFVALAQEAERRARAGGRRDLPASG